MDFLNDLETGLAMRLLAGVVGGGLALFGARFYPLAVMAPGLLLGAIAGLALTDLDDGLRAIIAVAVAAFGALVCRFVERAAVASFGAVLAGGLVYTGWPMVLGGETPWWAGLIGAIVGVFLFPRAFRALLVPLTACLGALAVAWALNMQDNPAVLGGVAAVGTVLQFALSRKGNKKKKE